MADAASANDFLLVSREQVGNAISSALRLFVGRGRRYSVKQLSNATGVKDRVIECAMCRADSLDYRPLSLEALASVGRFLGAEFTNEWMPLMMQGAFDLTDEEPDPGALAADTSEDSAKLVRNAVDGTFDNDCPREMKGIGTRMVSRGAQIVAMTGRRVAHG